MLELLGAAASAIGSIASQPWAIALAGIASAVGIFLVKHFLTRAGDDMYHWLRRKIFGRRKVESETQRELASRETRTARERFSPFEVETPVDRYSVTEYLARGDIASIYSGTNRSDRSVILKVAMSTGDNDLLQNEANTLRALHQGDTVYNKHLPELLDQFRASSGEIGLVLAKIRASDLRTVRESYPQGIPQQHILWILRRTLAAVGHAHSRGIIHGNIDPSHILISAPDHNVFVIDWAYAIHKPAETGQGFKAINDHFSPPEVAQKKQPLPASDLYSIGKCMIYLLGGNVQLDTMPDNVDERIQRFIKFFTRTSALQRAQDAWQMYAKADDLREEVFGPHKFLEFKIQE